MVRQGVVGVLRFGLRHGKFFHLNTWQKFVCQRKNRSATKKILKFFFARKQSLWMVCGRGILKILRLQALGLGIAGMMGEGYVFTFLFSLFFLQ